MFVTCAILTSLAVQFSANDELVDPAAAPLKMLYSFCKQLPPCADAGCRFNPTASASRATAPIHRNRVENLVPMMVFLLVVCAHVYWEGGRDCRNQS